MAVGQTEIAWCDASWNPLRGCSRVSTGCEHCYAEAQAGRFSGPGQPYEGVVRKTSQGFKWTGKVRLIEKDLEVPLHWKKPRRIFVASMSDPFHADVPDAYLDKMFVVMALAEQHVFQLLTKRPERMAAYLAAPDILDRLRKVRLVDSRGRLSRVGEVFGTVTGWPLPHLWCGISCENQATANTRIPWLLKMPAATRFVSYEPALGPVDFHRIQLCHQGQLVETIDALYGHGMHYTGALGYCPRLDWVIAGGESGPKARVCDVAWIKSLVGQCVTAGVPVFCKQLGTKPYQRIPNPTLAQPNGYNTWDIPVRLKDRKGADPEEWEPGLRVQQFPGAGC